MSLDLAPSVVTGTEINAPATPRFYGVHVAVVTDVQDPDGQGRVKVRFPSIGDDALSPWARLATMMAGAGRGSWFVPDVGDEVLVAFEGGNPQCAIVIGALWNGKDDPPQSMDADNNVKAIVSRSGIRISLDDTDGSVALTLSTPGGHRITLADSGDTLTLENAAGNSIEIAPSGITLLAGGSKIALTSASIDMSTSMIKADAAMSKFSGVVKSDTNITNATVSSSYTPGAGNVW